jgi:hypothetical protein
MDQQGRHFIMEDAMNIDSLARLASPQDAIGTLVFKKGLDQQANQMASLLQALPPAPQPAHLGQSINLLA